MITISFAENLEGRLRIGIFFSQNYVKKQRQRRITE
jgi:hypothetical protein